jgi:PAS domain S-box-containing protein
MKKNNNISSEAAELRRKAEERLKKISKKAILPKTNEELLRLVHELQTHQIELEMINEELRDSREDVVEGFQQYTDLYDFAPVGYFNLKRDGTICRANLTGASMLGVDRSKLMNSRFGLFVSEGTRPAFNELLRKVFESKIKTSCELSLLKEGNELLYVNIDATADIDGQECKMTMVDITERLHTEETIKESEERFRSLFENSTIGLYRTTPQGDILLANPTMIRMLGFDNIDELAQRNLEQKGYEPDYPRSEFKSKIEKSGGIIGLVSKWTKKDGTTLDVLESAHAIRDSNGKTLYYDGTVEDITERLRAREALQRSESDLKEAQRVGRFGSWDWDTTTDTIIWSEEYYSISGLDPTQPPPGYEEYLKLYTPESAARLDAAVKESMQTGEGYQLDLEQAHLDGTNHWITVIGEVKRDDKGQIVGLRGTAQDITVRKNAEGALKESEQRYRSVAKSATDAIITTNSKGIIINWNLGAEIIFGYTQAEITGKNLATIIPQNYAENHVNGMKRIEQGGEYHLIGKTVELMGLHKSGNEFPLEFSLSEWEIKEEKFFTGIIRDITVRKRVEKELIAAKEKAESANKLKDAFIANISHEIRTPLNGILGMASIIKDTFRDNIKKEDEELFEGIDISSKRIIRTVDMILNYSRLQVGEFQIIRKDMELSPICENLVKEFMLPAKIRSLELTFQNKCGDVNVLADEYSITMAISNLIDNAIKFTNKGLINVILYKGNNEDIILDIKDTGIGISDEYIEMMYEPYQQEQMGYGRAYEGVGLGLSLVKKVLDLNNVKVFVESKKGEGTTFSINFGKVEQPIEVKYKKEIVPNIIPAPGELRKELVLLVEDDLMNQVTIRRFIKNRYSVIITDSSDEALEILNKNKVDIILMDISISGKKNGLELTKELKASKEFSHIPVIAVTAHAFEEDKQNALDAGCDSYLAKPFSKEALLNMIAGFARFTEKQK